MKNSPELYLSAREAAAELAISPATLYAYVSRGLIRSEPTPDSRKNRYRAEDVRTLKERVWPRATAWLDACRTGGRFTLSPAPGGGTELAWHAPVARKPD